MAYPAELRQRAEELRDEKLLIREIAEQIGVPKATVTRWLNPTFEEREREKARGRKFSKRKKCPLCKGTMADAASLCLTCYRKQATANRYWNRERIIEAIRQWADKHGHAPTYDEWTRSGKNHPAISTITDGPAPPFRTWSDALRTAGFTPRQRRSSKRMTPKERAAVRRRVREDRIKRALEKENNEMGERT